MGTNDWAYNVMRIKLYFFLLLKMVHGDSYTSSNSSGNSSSVSFEGGVPGIVLSYQLRVFDAVDTSLLFCWVGSLLSMDWEHNWVESLMSCPSLEICSSGKQDQMSLGSNETIVNKGKRSSIYLFGESREVYTRYFRLSNGSLDGFRGWTMFSTLRYWTIDWLIIALKIDVIHLVK